MLFNHRVMTSIPDNAAVSPSANSARQARRVALIVAVAFFMHMLTMAVFVPLSAWLADRFGARNIFLLAMALFTLASVACGFSQSLTQSSPPASCRAWAAR